EQRIHDASGGSVPSVRGRGNQGGTLPAVTFRSPARSAAPGRRTGQRPRASPARRTPPLFRLAARPSMMSFPWRDGRPDAPPPGRRGHASSPPSTALAVAPRGGDRGTGKGFADRPGPAGSAGRSPRALEFA